MATFTRELKRELVRVPLNGSKGKRAAVAAVLHTGSALVTDEGFTISFEYEQTAAYVCELIEEEYGVELELSSFVKTGKRDGDKLIFSCRGDAAKKIAEDAAEYYTEAKRKEVGEEEAICLIRAAFLAGGNCTLPEGKTGYHLEFVLPDERSARSLADYLDQVGVIARVTERGGKPLVYVKSRESISDFLSLVGAERALKKFRAVGEEREESNNVNRVENCFSGNADRSATASANQVVAISELMRRGVLDRLDPSLRETATARLNNPTLSLEELAKLLKITKSCCNHRMRRLTELYKRGVNS